MMPVDKITAQPHKVFIHKRRQTRRCRQVGYVAMAHRTMPTPQRGMFIAKVLGQTLAEAMLGRKKVEHGMNPRHLRDLVLLEACV
jgi:hypothetical protein